MADKTLLFALCAFLALFLVLKIIKASLAVHRCPHCHADVARVKKNKFDRTIGVLSLGVLSLRRYLCRSCGWTALRSRHPRVAHFFFLY
jgi:transposase-like protein